MAGSLVGCWVAGRVEQKAVCRVAMSAAYPLVACLAVSTAGQRAGQRAGKRAVAWPEGLRAVFGALVRAVMMAVQTVALTGGGLAASTVVVVVRMEDTVVAAMVAGMEAGQGVVREEVKAAVGKVASGKRS